MSNDSLNNLTIAIIVVLLIIAISFLIVIAVRLSNTRKKRRMVELMEEGKHLVECSSPKKRTEREAAD